MINKRLAMRHSQIPFKARHVALLEMPAQAVACVWENRDSHTEEHVPIRHSHQTIVRRYVMSVSLLLTTIQITIYDPISHISFRSNKPTGIQENRKSLPLWHTRDIWYHILLRILRRYSSDPTKKLLHDQFYISRFWFLIPSGTRC